MENVIHDRFFKEVQERKITDLEIVKKLKVSKLQVEQWKQGYRNIPEKHLVQAIRHFNLDANWVIKGVKDNDVPMPGKYKTYNE